MELGVQLTSTSDADVPMLQDEQLGRTVAPEWQGLQARVAACAAGQHL
jgi:hypothetical protein